MQQLIDCDMTDLGCGGGLMDQAFQYDEDSVGLCALDDYPFAYHRHWFYGCSRYMPYCSPLPNSKVSKFVDVNKTEDALKAAIATQPVSVAVTAGPLDWQFYRKGIFNGGCDAEIDHGKWAWLCFISVPHLFTAQSFTDYLLLSRGACCWIWSL